MKPQAAAIALSKVWRFGRDPGCVYPVNCVEIAEQLRIKVVFDDSLGDEFEAAFLAHEKLRVIVVNNRIRETGRKNFCVGHELGHASLHAHRVELRCSLDDLSDVAPHPQNIEQEANLFAMTLLMPADDFRAQAAGAAPTFETIARLSVRYSTSATATALRFVELAGQPASLVAIRDGQVAWSRWNKHMYIPIRRGTPLPDTIFPDTLSDLIDVDHERWLDPKTMERFDGRLCVSALRMPRYRQVLALVTTR